MKAALTMVLLLYAFQARAQPLTAKDIVHRMVEGNNLGFESGVARVRLVTTTKQGESRERVVESRSAAREGLTRTRITFLDPADVRGTTLLTLEQAGSEEDIQYLYLPALKRVRRIAGSAKNGSFMGTDFSYADMEYRDAERGDAALKPDETVANQPCYRVDVAVSGDDDSDYSKVEMWIDKARFLPLKMQFLDRSGAPLKVMSARRVERRGERDLITQLSMRNVQKGSETLLDVVQLDLDAAVPDSAFDQSTLGK